MFSRLSRKKIKLDRVSACHVLLRFLESRELVREEFDKVYVVSG